MDMDLSTLKILSSLWACLSERFPDLARSVLEVVGGATLVYRLLARYAVKGQPTDDVVLKVLGKIALNKKE